MLRLTLLAALLAVVALVGVIGLRTMQFTPPLAVVPSPAAKIGLDARAAAGNLSRALQIRTISVSRDAPPAAEAFAEFHALLERSFPRVHRAMSRDVVAGHSLLYTWRGADPSLEPILLSAHMDVVPVEPSTEADWTHPPFSGDIAGGFVWGRGSLDMKQSLMGYMEAAEALLARGFTPRRTIYFAFTHDEEIGSQAARAIAELLEAQGVRLLFTLDEGLVLTDGIVPGLSRPAALIGVAQKGYVTLELETHGEGGHSSTPPPWPELTNARLAQALVTLGENQMPARLTLPVARMFDELGPEMELKHRVILANLWLLEPVLLSQLSRNRGTNAVIRTTFAPSIMSSGVKENVLPQKGIAVINVRILPGESSEEVLNHVRTKFDEEWIEARIRGNEPAEPSRVTDPDGPAYQIVRKSVRQVFPNVAVAPGLLPGRTDTRRYERIALNSFLFLPSRMTKEDLPRFHGTNERIAIENYLEIIRFYAQVMVNSQADLE